MSSLPKGKNPYAQLSSAEMKCRNYFTFFKDFVRINEVERDFSYAKISDGASIVAINEKKEIAFVGQWRYPIQNYVWELPGGMIENGEKPLVAAKRELEEEAALKAEKWTSLGEFFMEGSIIFRKKMFFLAQNLTITHQSLDEDEAIEITWIPLEQALQLIQTGEIKDAATVLGIMLAKDIR